MFPFQVPRVKQEKSFPCLAPLDQLGSLAPPVSKDPKVFGGLLVLVCERLGFDLLCPEGAIPEHCWLWFKDK